MSSGGRQEEGVWHVLLEEEQVEVMDGFCYLGDMVREEGGAEAAVKARISSAWGSWRELASLLVNQSILLVNRAKVYQACVRLVLLYGAETWALMKQLENLLKS